MNPFRRAHDKETRSEYNPIPGYERKIYVNPIQNPNTSVGDFTCIADAAFESCVAHLCPWNGDRLIPVLTCGEQEIQKVPAIMPDEKTGAPCGACRELMVQMMPEHDREIEIMLDYEREKIVTLGELIPAWWI